MKIVFGIYKYYFMKQFNIFLNLTRLNKPIGFMLLFWPCSWGLAFAYINNNDLELFIYYLILFFLGSVLMRSAGCIFNDIVDKDFDKKVKRTQKRPLASNQISISLSFFYVIILCLLALLILLQFNLFTIFLGLASMFLAFSYPYMKRFTYWPQLFLGITFNWGIIMAWTAVNNFITLEIIILYISAIFWTLGYDTIYGAQDMSEDEIIGLKSTSIKFKKNINIFVAINYILCSVGFFYVLYQYIGPYTSLIFFILFVLSLVYQIFYFNTLEPKTCLNSFKLNNVSGFLFLMAIIFINN